MGPPTHAACPRYLYLQFARITGLVHCLVSGQHDFQECPFPARTDNMRVYSVRLPVAAPPDDRTSSPEGVEAALQPAGRDSSHLEGRLIPGKGVTTEVARSPVSGNRIAASP